MKLMWWRLAAPHELYWQQDGEVQSDSVRFFFYVLWVFHAVAGGLAKNDPLLRGHGEF